MYIEHSSISQSFNEYFFNKRFFFHLFRPNQSAASQNPRSAVETNSRQMYVSNCPCSCDQSGDSSSSYSIPQQQSVHYSSYSKPTGYEVHPQQASYAQSGYPSQTISYQPSYNVPQPSYQPQYEYSMPQQNYATQNYRPQYYRSAWYVLCTLYNGDLMQYYMLN